jgi:hypothetical protein
MCVRIIGQNGGRGTFGGTAWSVAATIKPVHVAAIVIPETENKHHSAAESLTHGCQASIRSTR